VWSAVKSARPGPSVRAAGPAGSREDQGPTRSGIGQARASGFGRTRSADWLRPGPPVVTDGQRVRGHGIYLSFRLPAHPMTTMSWDALLTQDLQSKIHRFMTWRLPKLRTHLSNNRRRGVFAVQTGFHCQLPHPINLKTQPKQVLMPAKSIRFAQRRATATLLNSDRSPTPFRDGLPPDSARRLAGTRQDLTDRVPENGGIHIFPTSCRHQ